MAASGEVVLRQRICLGRECRAIFFLCSHCDRGQRYCSLNCRREARRRQRRCANRRHQQSPEGRLDHQDRQRQYRQRQAERARRARVTDQGSLSITCPALSRSGAVEAIRAEVGDGSSDAWLPRWQPIQPGVWLCCRICGRRGRFIEPFPRIPQRR